MNMIYKLFNFVISFVFYVFLYFLFMFNVFMITVPNVYIEQVKYINEYIEILTFTFIAGCIWGFGNNVYSLILNKVTKIMEILSMKIKTKKISS